MIFLLKSNIFLYFNVKIYEFFGDCVRCFTWKVNRGDFPSRTILKVFALRLCDFAFINKSVLVDNDASPVVDIWLYAVLDVAEFGEELF